MAHDIPFSFATCSIGKPTDSLPAKLEALSEAGFHAVELAFPDILSYAKEIRGEEVAEDDYEALREVAKEIRGVCDRLDVKVMMLQPFANFEGWPEGSAERPRSASTRAWSTTTISAVVVSIANPDPISITLAFVDACVVVHGHPTSWESANRTCSARRRATGVRGAGPDRDRRRQRKRVVE